jgi:periplasmic protein TonB
MFEQLTLSNGPAGRRAWTTCFGITTQVAVVSLAMMVPMVWPQVLPTARLLETLTPPLPPAPAPRPLLAREAIVRTAIRVPWSLTAYQPSTVPTRIYEIVDEPVGTGVVGSPAGSSIGSDTGVVGSILQDMSRNIMPVAPPRIATPVAPTPAPAPVIHRYKEGGNVMLGAVLHRAEPPYPQIAKAARVSGSVQLECVVGVDGHIQEVKVKSGNPLLIRAAVDAAWQWVYAPSKLNSVPIEIVTILTFTFKLN